MLQGTKNYWHRWLRRPQDVLLRRIFLQIHLWTGIAIGLYILMICLTGSVLVYRNELYVAYSPKPLVVMGSGRALPMDDLKSAALRAYPGFQVTEVRSGTQVNQAVEITLQRGEQTKSRLFHPFTGQDLGDRLPFGFQVTAWMLDLHDNLLEGRTGRRVNGIGALLVLALCVTGAVLWWPGIRTWKRGLTFNLRSNWKRLNWSLHSALGFWFFGFVLLWGITGLYLSFPDLSAKLFDYLEPFNDANPGERIGDRIQYWLAYLHFGRLGGRGIPHCGRGLCDSIAKATWAAAALIPPVLFVTGAIMWWNRVLRPRIIR